MTQTGRVNPRSLAITTAAVLMAVMAMLPADSGTSDVAADTAPRVSTDPADLPAGYPGPDAVEAAAVPACLDLPVPGASASEVRACRRYFAAVALDASVAAYETGARTPDELAQVVCAGRDCAPVYAAEALAGLSKYQWPRVRLTASLSIASALSYVSRYVS